MKQRRKANKLEGRSRARPANRAWDWGSYTPRITHSIEIGGSASLLALFDLPGRRGRLVPDRDHVTVANDVVPPLGPQEPALAGLGVAAGVNEVLPADHLRSDEAGLDVAVDPPGRVPGGETPLQGAGPCLAPPVGCEERDELQQVVGRANQALETGLVEPEVGAHLSGLLGRKLGQLGFDPGAHDDAR